MSPNSNYIDTLHVLPRQFGIDRRRRRAMEREAGVESSSPRSGELALLWIPRSVYFEPTSGSIPVRATQHHALLVVHQLSSTAGIWVRLCHRHAHIDAIDACVSHARTR